MLDMQTQNVTQTGQTPVKSLLVRSLVLSSLIGLVTACANSNSTAKPKEKSEDNVQTSTGSPSASGSSTNTQQNQQAVIDTSFGKITVALDAKAAPKTVENFVGYAKSGHYNQTIFHRVIDGFMIQGGGFSTDNKEKETRSPIAIESNNGLKNDKYTISMARTGNPNSATAQFFINLKDNDFLNYTAPTASGYGYTVFGKVIEGQNVVDKIGKVETVRNDLSEGFPTQAVKILSVSVK